LWCADLDAADWSGLGESSLDEAERTRVASMVEVRSRVRYGRSRSLLRRILARYVGGAPAALQFDVLAHGKPLLLTAAGAEVPLQFNLSHSRSGWLLAVTAVDPLGVDLELPREVPNAARLAERVFSAAERQALAEALAVSPAQRDALFLQCWTRKEAALKALGGGFTLGAASLHVGFGSGIGAEVDEESAVLSHPRHPSRPFRITSIELPWPAYAACAHPSQVTQVDCCWLNGAVAA
jgi:4'-phosphopantetheinyl transferase